MEKIDKIINIVKKLKEEMVTGSSSGVPGFSEKSPSEGPTAGYSPNLGSKKVYARAGKNSRKWWLQYLKRK